MEEVQMTVEEQDARLAVHTEKLRAENEIKQERVRQMEEFGGQQRKSILELKEVIARSHAEN